MNASRRALLRAGFASMGLLVAGLWAWSAYPALFNTYPVYVRMYPQACRELRDAARSGAGEGATSQVPCAFEGYLFPVGAARQYLVVYGVSENVRGQCMLLAAGQLDPAATELRRADGPARRKTDIPAVCRDDYALGMKLVGH